MSADSPRRGVHKGAQVISPQPIVDRTIIDSVAGIINDIVPQAYAGTPNSDNKESISWARFEYADINDPALYPDYNEGSSTPPLLLVLGYTTGVQVWLIAATGEATEVLSWRQGIVRTLRILPNPKTDDEHVDPFDLKRPMVAICDSAGPGPQFCNINFISLKTGEQAKSIKFKNPVCDVLANRRSVVVTFLEKIAVFDARTLEDVLTVTTCYASPGPNPNPVALGTRWLAYSEKKLLPAKRSSGGCEGEGVQSYTATVLYAAKSLGKGLRGLGETVASSLTGNSVIPVVVNNTGNDVTQPGVITILDLHAAKEEKDLDDSNIETVIAHFTAHSDAIVAMTFDLSGALLMTADRRGHDFHVFRIQPHPGGPTLAAVHHLYVLHRGDTTAKVQDMVFSSDTRWAAISTVRGTTHVFPVAPYGGPVGVRTHSTPHVVNRLSRFHRSAGLMDDGSRSHSPVSHTELPLSVYPYSNPRLPPYPHPTVLHPLAQIRQPSTLNHVNSQAQQSKPQQRQRLHSDDSGTLPLKICACFAPPRAWMFAQRESTTKVIKRAVDSLFIMACHGNMIQYDLEPKPAAGVPKEKVCDDTMIELEVEAKGQWPLLRSPNSLEIIPPLPTSSPMLSISTVPKDIQDSDLAEDRWLSQVEIVTHAGPHRRLWMGPQFVFKTYNSSSGVAVNLVEAEAIEVGVTGGSRPARSNPVNMPHAASRSLVPVVIDGSGSSYEQSPRFMEAYGDSLDSENVGVGSGENQLREDLAEAMLETSIAPHRAPGRRLVFERVGQPVAKVVNPLGTVITVSADEEDINSSQEFDSAEESHVPEPPRSVCAEEGPASLDDLEPESQTLRDLTEICAEMRSASEPAIDSVPDENICEVKERKALCVEMAAITSTGGTAIDFEKEEAFRDVPTSLSLCVEKGEIPSSPMTQAKENAWCKGFGKKEDTGLHEKNLSEAQYVVNCDDVSVVLVENKLAQGRRNVSHSSKNESSKKVSESEKSTRKSGKDRSLTESSTPTETKTQVGKYVLNEHEDSIIIEDTTCVDSKNNCAKRKGHEKSTKEESKMKNTESKGAEVLKETLSGKSKNKAKSSSVQRSSFTEIKPDVNTDTKNLEKPDESIVEVEKLESPVKIDIDKTEECISMKTTETVSQVFDNSKLLPLEPPDEFSSSEYHIVDSSCCNKDSTLNQSDEDIEHIQSSEITQIYQSECIDSDKCTDITSCTESSPIMQRKNSKNTISDDDLEYIHRSELVDTSDVRCKEDLKLVDLEKEGETESNTGTNNNKRTTYSDDDLEHIQHSDVCGLTSVTTKEKEKCSKKSQEVSSEQAGKSKNSKKVKDIVVIESDTSAADVTVIFKPHESWRSKNTEKKEDFEECVNPKETVVTENPSPIKKVKSRPTKTSPSTVAPKRSQTGIEIIDIDAMQKAEMEILTDVTSTPECKILSVPEVSGTRTKKSRKNKKSHADNNVQSTVETGSSKTTEELTKESNLSEESGAVEISWSSIVKKKNTLPTESEVAKDFEKIDEIEEVPDNLELVKSNSPISKVESGHKKIQDTSSKSKKSPDKEITISENFEPSSSRSAAVIDELREAVIELDTEESHTQSPGVSWSSVVKKKVSSPDLEVLNEPDVETVVKKKEPDSVTEGRKTRRKQCESSFRYSSMTTKTLAAAIESDNEESLTQMSEDTWSCIVRKKKLEGSNSEDESPCVEENNDRRNQDIITETTETTTCHGKKLITVDTKLSDDTLLTESMDEGILSNLSNSPVNQIISDESSKVEVLNEIVKDVPEVDQMKPIEDQISMDPAFTKEDSSEPEKEIEPEKRSDSEQEIIPERSSSSDELNANVVFTNTEGDSTREIVEKSINFNGSTSSACATAKKGNRSKKKKRR